MVSRPPAAALVIDEGQRVALEGLAAPQAAPHRQVKRAKALLLAAGGGRRGGHPRHLSEPLGDVLRQTYGRVRPFHLQSRLPGSTLRPGDARQSSFVGYTRSTRTRSIASAVLRSGWALRGYWRGLLPAHQKEITGRAPQKNKKCHTLCWASCFGQIRASTNALWSAKGAGSWHLEKRRHRGGGARNGGTRVLRGEGT